MAAATIAGISTLGIKFGYAAETTAGEKPAAFTQLERCNSIAGIALNAEQIDASALEDLTSRYVAGRQDSGGTWGVTFNFTSETETQLTTMISAYNTAKAAGKNMWFETIVPGFTDGFFVVAQPPEAIPQPEMGQNSLLTVEFPLIIVEPKGMSTKVAFT